MTAPKSAHLTAADGLGLGWTRVADALAERIPADDIKRLWVFRRLRQEEREWGTAVAARSLDDERLEIYTARYVLITRGREKGQGRVEVTPVGLGREDVIEEVLRGVQERSGEVEPPVEISPDLWYGGSDDESSSEN